MPGKRLNSQAHEFVLHVLDYFERGKRNGGPTLLVNAGYEICILIPCGLTMFTECLILQRFFVFLLRRGLVTKDLRKSSKLEVRNIVYNTYKERKHVTFQILKDEFKTKEIVTLYRQSLATLLMDIGLKFHEEDNTLSTLDEIHSVTLLQSVFLNKYIDDIFIG